MPLTPNNESGQPSGSDPTPGTHSHSAPDYPKSKSDLFWSFSILALQGFGGVLAIAQHELVERKKWMTREEFIEEWAVAQILPGPNIVNLAIMFGDKHFGWRGAVAAVAGMLVVPMGIVLALALTYAHYATTPIASGALRGMGAVAAGLIIATGLKLASAFKTSPMGLPIAILLCIASFVAVGLMRWPILYVLLIAGPIGWGLAYRKFTSK